MRTLTELAAEGLRGKALTDALYEEMFGHPPPAPDLTPEQRQRSWEEFFALMDTFSPEELNDGFMDHRPAFDLFRSESDTGASAA